MMGKNLLPVCAAFRGQLGVERGEQETTDDESSKVDSGCVEEEGHRRLEHLSDVGLGRLGEDLLASSDQRGAAQPSSTLLTLTRSAGPWIAARLLNLEAHRPARRAPAPM